MILIGREHVYLDIPGWPGACVDFPDWSEACIGVPDWPGACTYRRS